jgi:DNA-binding transcriptional ArsR family regulator
MTSGEMSDQHPESIAHPAREEIELVAVLHALSDPVRLTIVAELARTEHEYTCGSFELPVTKSTCTHHFKVLREAGLIHQRHKGTMRLNALRREDLDTRFPGLLETVLQAAGGGTVAAGTQPAGGGTVAAGTQPTGGGTVAAGTEPVGDSKLAAARV